MKHRALLSDLLVAWIDLLLIIASLIAIASLSGCAGSPTAPTPAEVTPACQQIIHPETRRTESVLVGGRLQFVTIVTPAWTEVVCGGG